MKSTLYTAITGLVALQASLGLCQTSVEDIIADISGSVRADHSTFWAADPQNRQAAEVFSLANGHMTIRDADPHNRWRAADPETQTNWSRTYARLSSGTGFVFWKDTDEIPSDADGNWQAEKNELMNSKSIYEMIQVDRSNTGSFV
ncbi:hypothetical protein SAMD00023353_2901250 [Rosellinia necatrix]|uniref:Uncharacterized protein n=1 Tax=Rosellinia necatrix TaxID=77044 RepID=A0A1W2TJP2_ROSNE|nr:hypothetical protein SAMD00023353_2901250 [Rosellinia necatrix]